MSSRASFILLFVAGCGGSTQSSVHDLAVGSASDMAATGMGTQKLKQTNLTADATGAANTDATLLNAWGLAFNPAGPAWIADNHSGLATVYDSTGKALSLVVTVPPPAGGAAPSAPTGQIYNGSTAFMGDKFIFSTEDGTISGWQSGTSATLRADHSTSNAIYKGLAALQKGGASRLYAADFHNGKVDVFDGTYAPVTTLGTPFVDPSIPSGFAPFNVNAIGSTLYVTYAKQDDMAEDDSAGAGNGYIDTYDFDGKLLSRFVSGGPLNSPWAVVQAPSDFGALSNLVLVGNFGDGAIHAFDTTGVAKAEVLDAAGSPLVIGGLWALVFGNDTPGQAHNELFFTAGPDAEAHGLYGRLDLN